MSLLGQLTIERLASQEEKQHQKIMKSTTIDEFIEKLNKFPCNRCSLSKLNNRVVIYKGNTDAKIMLVGEAPGKQEDAAGIAFCGPAGQLQDKIFKSVGISTTKDMYLGNICKCRPTAPDGSGKQNFTPKEKQTKLCKPYILKEIELLDPKIIIAVGKTAAVTLFNFEEKTLMKHVVGKFFKDKRTVTLRNKWLFTMYHPAAILHAGGQREQELKKEMWRHVQKIRKKVDDLGINLKGV